MKKKFRTLKSVICPGEQGKKRSKVGKDTSTKGRNGFTVKGNFKSRRVCLVDQAGVCWSGRHWAEWGRARDILAAAM